MFCLLFQSLDALCSKLSSLTFVRDALRFHCFLVISFIYPTFFWWNYISMLKNRCMKWWKLKLLSKQSWWLKIYVFRHAPRCRQHGQGQRIINTATFNLDLYLYILFLYLYFETFWHYYLCPIPNRNVIEIYVHRSSYYLTISWNSKQKYEVLKNFPNWKLYGYFYCKQLL